MSTRHSGCLKLLARLGFEYRKPKGLPRVSCAEQQAAFIDMYDRLLNGLGAEKRCISPTRCIPNTRQNPELWLGQGGLKPCCDNHLRAGRVNIHGALNLENFDAPFVEPTTVDGVSAAQLLARIEARNPDKRLIHVIWDNAAYHKGPDVSESSCKARLPHPPDPTARPIART